jgi:hypothetical protein
MVIHLCSLENRCWDTVILDAHNNSSDHDFDAHILQEFTLSLLSIKLLLCYKSFSVKKNKKAIRLSEMHQHYQTHNVIWLQIMTVFSLQEESIG